MLSLWWYLHPGISLLSTQDVLLKVTEDWKFTLDIDNLVGIVFIGTHKAFDSTDHSLLSWWLMGLMMFLCNGSKVIYMIINSRLDRVYSDRATVMRGVLQGSVLEPLLFIIYMNNLLKVKFITSFHLHLLADYIVIYTSGAGPAF